MIHCRSETVAPVSRWIVGRAMLTTVLSSIAIARAKHMVRSTITFSRAFSPLNPRTDKAVSFHCRAAGDAPSNRQRCRRCSRLGEPVVQADRERGEERDDADDPERRPQDQLLDGPAHVRERPE